VIETLDLVRSRSHGLVGTNIRVVSEIKTLSSRPFDLLKPPRAQDNPRLEIHRRSVEIESPHGGVAAGQMTEYPGAVMALFSSRSPS
jgi:hypothetical protein